MLNISQTVTSIEKRSTELMEIIRQNHPSKNHKIRVLHANIELTVLNLEEENTDEQQNKNIKEALEKLRNISSSMKCGYAHRPKMGLVMMIIDKVDEFVRLIGVWSFLASMAIIFSIPALIVRGVDYMLVKLGVLPHHKQMNVAIKWFINRTILKLSGIHMVIEGLKPEHFKNDVALACFSHASTMDAFILSGTLPVQQITMVKSDLFLVPFFSWLMFAFGCVPIDR